MVKLNISGNFSVRSLLPSSNDLIIGLCRGNLGNVMFHSSKSELVLQFTFGAPPEHTYSTPAGSRSMCVQIIASILDDHVSGLIHLNTVS